MVKLTDKDVLVETAGNAMYEMFPDWSVDELLLHPDDAKRVCVAVRGKLCKRTPDDEILRALLNGRKQGNLPDRRS